VACMGKGYIDEFRALVLEGLKVLFVVLPDVLFHALDEILARYADLEPLDVPAQEGMVVGDGFGDGGGIEGVVPRDDAEHGGAVAHGPGEGAYLVEGRGKGYEAVTGDPAVGGFHADDAAEARRLADGTARVGAEGADAESRGNRRGGTAA